MVFEQSRLDFMGLVDPIQKALDFVWHEVGPEDDLGVLAEEV